MDHRASAPTVAAVVAAYNEEQRVGAVLEILTTYPAFQEVIVVDDGSTDGTAAVAEAAGATCLRLPVNRGKGAALEAGIRHAGTDVIFFADADIRDLDHTTIAAMIEPVAAGEADMFVAMRHRSLYVFRTVLRFLPLLSGERVVSAKLWHAVPPRFKHRFKIEAALNFYAVHHGRGLRYRVFPISQTRRERKYGLWRGLTGRARMTVNVAAAIAELQLTDVPADARSRRRAATTALLAVGGLFASTRGRGAAAGTVGGASGLVLVTQLVRLAQSQARADG